MSLDNLDQKLEAEQPTLSASEETLLWQRISPLVSAPKMVVSPYSAYLSLFHSRAMTSLIIALIFIMGAGGTVAVSEAAKPGDILFPIERVAEKARLAFAGEEKAAELRTAYATERLEELLEIIEEEGTINAYDDATFILASSTRTVDTFSAEADVFTDVTIVKVELNDQRRTFSTSATTKAGVVAEIALRYGVATSTIEATLDFEVEDRVSRRSERGVVLVDDSGEERISKAVNVLLDLLGEVDNEDDKNVLLKDLLSQIDNVSVRGRDDNHDNSDDSKLDIRSEENRVRIDDNRIEVREDGYRIRIDKNGEVRVKEDEDSEEDSDSRHDEDRNSSKSVMGIPVGTSTKIRLEVEADVYTDITEVKVELNNVKTSFVTLAKTREAIAQEVSVLYRVDKTLVLQVLDLEIEDSRSTEETSESENDDDDYNEDEDEDEDEDDGEEGDDDRRGHGSDDEDEDDEDDEDEEDDHHSGRDN